MARLILWLREPSIESISRPQSELSWKGSREDIPPPQLIARRARIILMSNEEGMSNVEIATRLGINKAKVTLWTQRWIERGLEPVLDRLSDLPRPGAPDTITPDHGVG